MNDFSPFWIYQRYASNVYRLVDAALTGILFNNLFYFKIEVFAKRVKSVKLFISATVTMGQLTIGIVCVTYGFYV